MSYPRLVTADVAARLQARAKANPLTGDPSDFESHIPERLRDGWLVNLTLNH